MAKVFIWLDDEENRDGWKYGHMQAAIAKLGLFDRYITCRTVEDVIAEIVHNWTDSFFISFDHDLGPGKDGYYLAKWLVEFEPHMLGYNVHSMNPVGRQNITQLLDHYGVNRIQ